MFKYYYLSKRVKVFLIIFFFADLSHNIIAQNNIPTCKCPNDSFFIQDAVFYLKKNKAFAVSGHRDSLHNAWKDFMLCSCYPDTSWRSISMYGGYYRIETKRNKLLVYAYTYTGKLIGINKFWYRKGKVKWG